MPLPSLREQAFVVPLLWGVRLDNRSDDELARLAKGGQREAFEQLVLRHQGPSLQLAWKYLDDTTLAKDACQGAFLEMYKALATYQPRERFVFWLRRIVINQCRMVARAAQARKDAGLAMGREPARTVERPDELLIKRQRQRAVEVALQDLSDKLREVAVLRYVSGHSLEEIASILELPLGTVKSRLFTAFAALRENLGGGP